MAVELGLNRYVPKPPEDESDEAYRERRDRERTYLVLFVHDRSLGTQTGRNWMLPEDDLIRNSMTWHESRQLRPEDVIVAAQVQLRRIAVCLFLDSASSTSPLTIATDRRKRLTYSTCTRGNPACCILISITRSFYAGVMGSSQPGPRLGTRSWSKVSPEASLTSHI